MGVGETDQRPTHKIHQQDKRLPMHNITAIKKAYKPTTTNIELSYDWDMLVKFITTPRNIQEKKELPLWSPATFHCNDSLTNDNVKEISMAVFDIDNGVPWETHKSFDAYQYIAHTSFSHQEKNHKWRLIIPFESPIPARYWPLVWQRLQSFFISITGQETDISCKDARRFYYLPAADKHFVGFYPNPKDGWRYRWVHNDYGRTLSYDFQEMERILFDLEVKRKATLERKAQEKTKRTCIPEYSRDFRSEMIEDLSFEASSRISLGRRIGAKIVLDRAVNFPCPKCGRKDATFFYLDPCIMYDDNDKEYATNIHAYCWHKNSCGNGTASQWTLWGLARALGVG